MNYFKTLFIKIVYFPSWSFTVELCRPIGFLFSLFSTLFCENHNFDVASVSECGLAHLHPGTDAKVWEFTQVMVLLIRACYNCIIARNHAHRGLHMCGVSSDLHASFIYPLLWEIPMQITANGIHHPYFTGSISYFAATDVIFSHCLPVECTSYNLHPLFHWKRYICDKIGNIPQDG